MKTVPMGNEAIPRGERMPESRIRGGYSAFSAGPLMDTTPHDIGMDSYQMSTYGPPFNSSDKDHEPPAME